MCQKLTDKISKAIKVVGPIFRVNLVGCDEGSCADGFRHGKDLDEFSRLADEIWMLAVEHELEKCIPTKDPADLPTGAAKNVDYFSMLNLPGYWTFRYRKLPHHKHPSPDHNKPIFFTPYPTLSWIKKLQLAARLAARASPIASSYGDSAVSSQRNTSQLESAEDSLGGLSEAVPPRSQRGRKANPKQDAQMLDQYEEGCRSGYWKSQAEFRRHKHPKLHGSTISKTLKRAKEQRLTNS